MPSPSAVVTEITDLVSPLVRDVNLASWAVNVHANPDTERRRVDAEIELQDVLSEAGLFARIEESRRDCAGGLERRQLDVLHNVFLPRQVPESLRHRIVELEVSVEADFATHRGILRGEPVDDNTLREVLRSSDDPGERREAWEASKTIGGVVADRVRELARLRNEAARTLGFRDWFALAVSVMEMDEQRLFATLEETERVTEAPFAAWKATLDDALARRYRCHVQDLRPWHYDDPFFQEVPSTGGVQLDDLFMGRNVVELASTTFGQLDLDPTSIIGASDLFPRVGKCQHAFCLDVDREGDVRVLANVRDDHYWAETMLHELGHGVHGLRYGEGLPWLLRDAHLAVTEGIAILMGRLASDPAWLREVAGLAGDADALARPLQVRLASDLLVFTRWVLVMTNFERRLYASPDDDLGALWWDLVHQYQLVHAPGPDRPTDWAAKIHVACAPVYYHTYLYGNLLASQIAASLGDGAGAGAIVGRGDAGRFLEEKIFAPGESIRWDHLVERATGEPLSVRHYAADIASGA